MLHSFYNAGGKEENCLDVLVERQVPTRCADNRMWAVANNFFSTLLSLGEFCCRPDATIAKRLTRNEAGMMVHEFPDTLSDKGWYHNFQPMRIRQDEPLTFGAASDHPRQADGTSKP